MALGGPGGLAGSAEAIDQAEQSGAPSSDRSAFPPSLLFRETQALRAGGEDDAGRSFARDLSHAASTRARAGPLR